MVNKNLYLQYIKKTAKVTDPTEVFSRVLDYIIGRIPNRFNTLEECEEKFNSLFKECLTVVQDNYNRFYKTELRGNLKGFGIEIMGGEPTVEAPETGFQDDGKNPNAEEGEKKSPGEAAVDNMEENGNVNKGQENQGHQSQDTRHAKLVDDLFDGAKIDWK